MGCLVAALGCLLAGFCSLMALGTLMTGAPGTAATAIRDGGSTHPPDSCASPSLSKLSASTSNSGWIWRLEPRVRGWLLGPGVRGANRVMEGGGVEGGEGWGVEASNCWEGLWEPRCLEGEQYHCGSCLCMRYECGG